MLSASVIQAVLSVILSTVANLTTNAEVDNIITVLENWLPTIISEFTDLVPVVQNIISTLQGASVLTADQITAINALNASSDAAFDAAAAGVTAS